MALTLALGGIGLRAAVNIGVLQALEDMRIRIKAFRATGLSTLVAAFFSLRRDPWVLLDYFEKFFRENRKLLWELEVLGGVPLQRKKAAARSFAYFLREALFCRLNLSKISVFSWKTVLPWLVRILGDTNTGKLRIPLAVGVIDLDLGKEVMLREGTVIELVQAGLAFPGLFPPVKLNGHTFVSSASFRGVPLAGLLPEERPLMAVVVPTPERWYRPSSLLEVLARADELRERALTDISLQHVDIILRLDELSSSGWARAHNLSKSVEEAYNQAIHALQHFFSPPTGSQRPDDALQL